MSTNFSVIPELSVSANTPSNGSSIYPETHDEIPSQRNQPIFKLNALCVQALLFPIIVFIYLLIGAAILAAAEIDYEEDTRVAAQNEIQDIVKKISWKANLSENTTKEILGNLTYLCTNNYLQAQNASHRWEFLPAFFFAANVITAIGRV